MTDRRRGLLALLAGYGTCFAVLLRVPQQWWTPILLLGLTCGCYPVLILWLRRGVGWSDRVAMRVVTAVGAGLQALAVTGTPSTSDDVYRYIWDGKVQLAGIDPYRFTPQAPQLRALRDRLLFGSGAPCVHPIPGGCTAINRPDVHTVYPPVAQAAFDLVRILSFGGHGGVLPFEIVAALGATAVTLVLASWARRAGRPAWQVAVWAWCPIVVVEFANNAHIDWAAVLLGVLGVLSVRRGRAFRGGVLIGAAIMTKLYPALLLPALLRRRPWAVLGGVAATIVVAYVPHVAAVGTHVVGFLPGYLQQEGYTSGSRLLLLGAVLPHPFDSVAGVVVMSVVTWWAWRRTDRDSLERMTVVVGVAFLVTTPLYGWYAALLVGLVALSGRWAWLPVAFAPIIAYDTHSTAVPGTLVYVVAALATCAALAGQARCAPRQEPASDIAFGHEVRL